MQKYSQTEKDHALRFFEENFTAREISEFLGIPEGTLYRWKSEGSSKRDPKSEQTSAVGTELLELRQRIAELERYLQSKQEEKVPSQSSKKFFIQ